MVKKKTKILGGIVYVKYTMQDEVDFPQQSRHGETKTEKKRVTFNERNCPLPKKPSVVGHSIFSQKLGQGKTLTAVYF